MKTNRQIVLATRPKGTPTLANFEVKQSIIPQIQEGQVLIRSLYLSVDPYMRGRMNDRPSYIPSFEIAKPLTGGIVGEVIESKNSRYKIGDTVIGMLDFAEYPVSDGNELQKIDPKTAPVSTALGILGMPGMTAYFGLLDIGAPKKGETVVVSGAAGAVGTLVGQIAKIKGCRVVGIAGGAEKIHYLTKDLGFDAAIDYKSAKFAEELKASCPSGVDVYFDNVGGGVTDQVMPLINWHARIVVCGQIAMYNLETPDIGPRHFRSLIVKSAMAKGFIVSIDYKDRFPEGIKQMAEWMKEGKIQYRESVLQGIENVPKAFLGLFTGDNIGKQIVKIV